MIYSDKSLNINESYVNDWSTVRGKEAKTAVIKDTYRGKPVTFIGGSAFACTNITSVYIPASIKVLGAYAFFGCRCLETIYLPDTLIGMAHYERSFENDCRVSCIIVRFGKSDDWLGTVISLFQSLDTYA